MFGQVIRGRVKDRAGLQKQFDRWQTELRPGAIGYLGATAGVTDDGEFIAVARFGSEEEARRNSDRPEQGAWWRETEQYLDEVTFADTTDIDTTLGGGSDDAGFVQVIEGRAKDKEMLRQRSRDLEEMVQKERPDVIGGVTYWSGDRFTDVVYFKSESEAREGERRMGDNAESQERINQFLSSVDELRFLDLREPWLR